MPEASEVEARDPNDADFAKAQKLLSVFDRQNEDGEYLFSDEDVRHFLPLMLLALGGDIDPAALGDSTQQLMGELAVAAGIEDTGDPADVAAKITAFYEENPPNEELVAAVNQFLREGLAEGDRPAVSKAVQDLIGGEASNRPVGAEPAPEGALRGPLAAVLANKGKPKK